MTYRQGRVPLTLFVEEPRLHEYELQVSASKKRATRRQPSCRRLESSRSTSRPHPSLATHLVVDRLSTQNAGRRFRRVSSSKHGIPRPSRQL